MKASDRVPRRRRLSQLWPDQVDCPLIWAFTEAGGLIGGTVTVALGIGSLLWGIATHPSLALGRAEEEVRVGYEILKSLGIRSRGVRVVSAPSCARQGFDVIRTVEASRSGWQHIKLRCRWSVLGASSNGPGEARETDIALLAVARASIGLSVGASPINHVQDAEMIEHIVKWWKRRRPRSKRRTSLSLRCPNEGSGPLGHWCRC